MTDTPPESHWNHRVMRKEVDYNGEKHVTFGIHEVYYTKGKPTSWTVDAMGPRGETLDELKQSLEWMQAALSKPVLDYDHEPEEDK